MSGSAACSICGHRHREAFGAGLHPCYLCARCDADDAKRETVKDHDTQFCVLCLSGEH